MTQSLSRTIERVIIAFELTVIIVCICGRWGGEDVTFFLLIFYYSKPDEDMTIFFKLIFYYFLFIYFFAFKSTAL